MPEGRRLFAGMTVRENLWLAAASLKRPADEGIDLVLDLFPPLRNLLDKVSGSLSGGEQQMCAIGRALMSGPRLLLLDEPSAGLAPVIVQSIFGLMQTLRAEGYTVLVVEQNVRQVLGVVDRAYLMETGRMRASGTAAEMLSNDAVRKAYLGI